MAFAPITDLQKITYQRNVQLAVQQLESPWKRAMTFHPNLKGKQAQIVENIGTTEADRNAARGSETPNKGRNQEPIWMRPEQIDWGRTIEKEDDIKNIVDYTSYDVQEGAAAMARREDEVYADAVFGPRLVGNEAPSSVAWVSTGNLVARNYTGSNQPMVPEKIHAALRILQSRYVDIAREEIYLAINAYQIEKLYGALVFTSADYRDRKVMEQRVQLEFRNVRFVHTERLPTPGANQKRCGLFAKRALHRGEFSPLETNVDRDPRKKFRPVTYMETWVGAARSEDELVIGIDCDDL